MARERKKGLPVSERQDYAGLKRAEIVGLLQAIIFATLMIEIALNFGPHTVAH